MSTEFDEAEDYFTKAWDVDSLDRDFYNHPQAQKLYEATQVDGVEHFVVPMEYDDDRLIHTRYLPLTLFSEKYRDVLEDKETDPQDRLYDAIEAAESAGFEADITILEMTETELEDEDLI